MPNIAPMPSLPDKLSFKIGEASTLVGVKAHVLRFWEREFTVVRPQKTRNGHRIYSRKDVLRLQQIRTLLHDRGYTIAGAKALLRDGDDAVNAALSARPSEAVEALRVVEAEKQETHQALQQAEERRRSSERALAKAKDEALFWRSAAQKAESRLTLLQQKVLQESATLERLFLTSPLDSKSELE